MFYSFLIQIDYSVREKLEHSRECILKDTSRFKQAVKIVELGS